MANPNLTKTLSERSRSYKEPYEFIFKINSNIIVQRFFSVNSYNPNTKGSLELKDAVDTCVGMIREILKKRTLIFMDDYKYFFEEDPMFDNNDSDDKYYFQVKVNGRPVIEQSWDATIYPAKIRYDVNIRKSISKIINIVQVALSAPDEEITTNYLGYSLLKRNK